jgi:AraC-like DNA-binding protein
MPAPAAGTLGSMSERSDSYVEIAPPPVLARFVECLWVHRFGGPAPPEGRRLLPDGRVNMVWISDVGVRIAGSAQRFMRPPPLDRLIAFGVRFHPGAASYVLRTNASDLVDVHVHLDDIDPAFSKRVDDRLSEAPTVRAALIALIEEVARQLDSAAAPDPAVRHAVVALDRSAATVADAAAKAYISERELQRRFVRDVGYAPKTLQRVLRFQRFMGQLHLPRVELAGAAALAGYSDQSHLSREARRLSGLSPRQLVDYRH